MSHPSGKPPGQYPPPYNVPIEPPPPYTPPGQYTHQGQYLPPGQQTSTQPFPPSSYPRQQYGPPPSAPGAYYPPPAPGQYPPPGAPGQYPPAAAGQYPPPVDYSKYPSAQGQQPVSAPLPSSIGPHGYDTYDSGSEDYVCTKNSQHPMEVTFINRSRNKVQLYWLDENGDHEKITSLKPNVSKDMETWETHPFFAVSKNDVVINGNFVFFPQKFPGSHGNMKAEITEGPRGVESLRSPLSGFHVTVKFSNRTNDFVSIKWINVNGQPQIIKDVAPMQAWIFHSCEGHNFIACERGREDNLMELNRGWFYLVKRGPNPQSVSKVLITQSSDRSVGSSSS